MSNGDVPCRASGCGPIGFAAEWWRLGPLTGQRQPCAEQGGALRNAERHVPSRLRLLGRHVLRPVLRTLAKTIRFHNGSDAAPSSRRICGQCAGLKKWFCLRASGRKAFLAAPSVPGNRKYNTFAARERKSLQNLQISPLAVRSKSTKKCASF